MWDNRNVRRVLAPGYVVVAMLAGCGRIGFAVPDAEREGVEADSSLAGDGSIVPVDSSIPTNGLVAYWAFDEAAGATSADLSGNNHHGQLINMEPTDWVVGVRGSALEIAVDDYFSYDCTGCPVIPYAVSLWFNANALSGALFSYVAGGSVSGNMTQKTIAFTGGVYLHAGPCSGALRRGAPITMFATGRWHHVAVNYPTVDRIEVFVDGVDVTVDTDDCWNSGSYTMGQRLNFSPLQYNGRIDEVRLYDRPLTLDEIAALAQP